MLAIEAAADSHVGCRRTNNEDSFAALAEIGLFMVADGLGGNAAGEVASQMAIDVVRAYFEESDGEETWPYEVARPDHHDEARLLFSVVRANRCILEASRRSAEMRGMATTFAGVLLAPTAACVAHVGDSRVYRYRDRRLAQLTRDHTLLEELRSHDPLTYDEVEHLGAHATAITRALGCDEAVLVDTRVEAMMPGDTFLVCSDGLWGVVPEDHISAILAWPRDLEAQVAGLIACALERGGRDNVTCVLARVGGG